MATVTLKPGREQSLRRHHPWVFSGAVAAVTGAVGSGETVDIKSADGAWLARAAFSPASQIRARVWTFEHDETIDAAFFARRLAAAVARRGPVAPNGAARLVYGESDGLPGLIVDSYAGHVVCQFSSAGAEHWRSTIVEQLVQLLAPPGIFDRSDVGVRSLEGLEERAGLVTGNAPQELIEIDEGHARYLVDVRHGHKTGFYLDQRVNRALVHARAAGRDVLNCFSYSRGFGIAAGTGGARKVTNIESSAPANALARRNVELNDIAPERFVLDEGDVFATLRTYRDAGRTFDLIVLDPPKFAESQAQVDRAARGYKDLNLWALKLLNPGGLLFTFSCSGHIKPDLFQKIVADAALDAGRDAQIVHRLEQAEDHPTALHFPEASYLKGLLVRAH